jgi:hypothetical protein
MQQVLRIMTSQIMQMKLVTDSTTVEESLYHQSQLLQCAPIGLNRFSLQTEITWGGLFQSLLSHEAKNNNKI